ncbi:MAG: lectin [Betaproteobacteria bacterium RIFCSPLOWO2_02_FULL_63_19]|nr:MAG: lectin [Betaproteobacteria bacterium RIFCSPLOWO2_02_FULL_63_19]
MTRFCTAVIAAALVTGPAMAQQAPPQFPNMTFFITSTGGPDGANFGGIEGADRHCQTLAAKAGAGGKTWRAYLSAQAADGKPAVNARDRIGSGPWVNARGVQVAANVDDLHSANNKINTETGVAENGRMIPGRLHVVNQHDILTGSTADGRAYPPGKDMTCGNWTKNAEGSAFVGHSDRMGLRDDAPSKSWNASHPSRGCSYEKLKSSGGAGLLYCFAAN